MSNGIISSNMKASGNPSIPAISRKMVQSLKEIVNCPDHEIYAMLRECNMDPNETVHCLLSQDTFHEVKSKREKKKEMKGSTESRPRGVGSTPNRGGRGGADRNVGHGGYTQFSSSDSGVMHGKPVYKKENGVNSIPSSSSASGGNNTNCWSTSLSDSTSTENAAQMIRTAERIFVSSQPSSGLQPAWSGVPGQLSMADIVKMGRPHSKASSLPVAATETRYSSHNSVLSSTSQRSVKHPRYSTPLPPEDPTFTGSEITQETSMAIRQRISHDDWPLVEQSPAASGSSVAEPSATSVYPDSSLHQNPLEENVTIENLTANCIGFASASDRQIPVDNSGGESHLDDISLKDKSSYQTQRLASEHQEGIGGCSNVGVLEYSAPSSLEDVSVAVSSVAASLRKLSFHKEELGSPPMENNPAVIIPDHLQVPTADCSHLSFGSFRSGISATFSGSFASKTSKSNVEETSLVADASSVERPDKRHVLTDASSVEHADTRHQVTSASNESIDYPLSSQPEVIKHDTAAEVAHGHRYPFPSSLPDYAFENATEMNAATYPYAQTSSQLQNLIPFSSEMAVNPTVFSIPQATQRTMTGTSIPTGPALPQHLPLHPYTQPALPLGHFADMFGYPFLPQNYAYVPSAFQQAYAAGNSSYHQSPAALPQYKNSVSISSLPQSATIASGYGGFGGSPNIPGNSTLNPSNTPPSTSVSYEDLIGSHYKDSNHHIPQQNEGSAMWVEGPGSRTMSAVPASTYYSLQGQNQHSGFRQSQQTSHYGAMGFANFYNSQTGVSQEHQQTSTVGALSAQQGLPSQQSHQIWQHSY
ncbi:GBF-interacting protein 1-like isoform X2 [Magnolia sinica]|uniref:GBF-interacting protein 1-like isoform X2 n=1 Tax=Magnolia sinica TaxID=86752 RepID=UPI00265A4150|nr:GBF-interacting protein 1-like isoform X2 [Magnolia sinica]